MIDHHLVAALALGGIGLSLLGSLYLAYDLLGGEHGPLRVMTRIVTYCALFGFCYVPAFGIVFGAVAAAGLGALLGWEYGGARHDAPTASRQRPIGFALLRGATLGIASGLTFGPAFGIVFGAGVAIGLSILYLVGYAPSAEFESTGRPRIRPRALIASGLRGVVNMIAGVVAGLAAHGGRSTLLLGVKIGVVVAFASAFVSVFSPFIEWWADQLPPRRLGAYGAALIVIGLALQSVEYWLALFDVPMR